MKRSGRLLHLWLLCVVLFCIALALSRIVNVWACTGLAAALAFVLSFWNANTEVRAYFRMPKVSGVGFGVGFGLLMAAATWGMYPAAVSLLPQIVPEISLLYRQLRQPPGPILALPILFFVVAAEELVWRGIAIDWLQKRHGAVTAVFVSAVTYVLPQVAFQSPLLMMVALVCGLYWGALRVRFQSLAVPLIAHLVWDLLIFVFFPLA